jgi:hypothetical protein
MRKRINIKGLDGDLLEIKTGLMLPQSVGLRGFFIRGNLLVIKKLYKENRK